MLLILKKCFRNHKMFVYFKKCFRLQKVFVEKISLYTKNVLGFKIIYEIPIMFMVSKKSRIVENVSKFAKNVHEFQNCLGIL